MSGPPAAPTSSGDQAAVLTVEASANCKFDAGVMRPVVDPSRCEAKGPCVQICPYGVLAVQVVSAEKKATLSLMTRFKLFVHGGRQAFALNQDACHGCGLCVQVCPEQAITLRRNDPAFLGR
jgi:4Fe-4S ferredoxin